MPTAETPRALVIGLLAGGFLIAALLLAPRLSALEGDRAELARTRALIRAKRDRIATVTPGARKRSPLTIAAPAGGDEDVRFRAEIRKIAVECDVRLAEAAEVAEAGRKDGGTPPPDGLPAGVRPEVLRITAQGTYPALVKYFARLETSPRLLSVRAADLRRNLSGEELTARFLLTRYIKR